MTEGYNTASENEIPKDAWDDRQKIDMNTGTNRYLQMQMQETLKVIEGSVNSAREEDNPFNTMVVLLARNDTDRLTGVVEDDDPDYDKGIERYFTQVGTRDYAIDIAIQFAIEASKELLKEVVDNNQKMTPIQYRQLEKGIGFNMIKRIIDDFELTDDDIDLNELKGSLSDVVQVTDNDGNPLDI